ncbi:MAG TPA: GGDEF domain-containing protein [Myxococcales bacterium]|nr:GGDEF domain-containing protein [Myxococcales bacterium]
MRPSFTSRGWVYPFSAPLFAILLCGAMLVFEGLRQGIVPTLGWLLGEVHAQPATFVDLACCATCLLGGLGAVVGRREDRLIERSTIDALTHVANRGCFEWRLEVELARAKKAKMPLSLLVVDLDHLKQVNDLRGHPAGDAVLKLVGRTLSESCRSRDLVARVGGDEFVVVAPRTDSEGALVLAARLEAAVRRRSSSSLWRSPPVTLSIGVADLASAPAGTGAALFQAADRALYLAKADGRDCAVAAPHFRGCGEEEEAEPACACCGSHTGVVEEERRGGVPFCGSCLERARPESFAGAEEELGVAD